MNHQVTIKVHPGKKIVDGVRRNLHLMAFFPMLVFLVLGIGENLFAQIKDLICV